MSDSNQTVIDAFWQRFVQSLPSAADAPSLSGAFMFGDNPRLADELAALIVQGVKTATCGDLWSYEAEGEALPEAGTYWVVLNGDGGPVAVIETVEVTLRRYDEVDAQFAAQEGEGDRSLAYWREAHRTYFSRTLPGIGRQFSEDMPLVCERFRLVYT